MRLIATDPGTFSLSRYPNLFICAAGSPRVVWQSPDNSPDVYYAKVGE